MTDEQMMIANFQDALGDLVDEYLKIGADPEWLRELMQQECANNLEARSRELDTGSVTWTEGGPQFERRKRREGA